MKEDTESRIVEMLYKLSLALETGELKGIAGMCMLRDGRFVTFCELPVSEMTEADSSKARDLWHSTTKQAIDDIAKMRQRAMN